MEGVLGTTKGTLTLNEFLEILPNQFISEEQRLAVLCPNPFTITEINGCLCIMLDTWVLC